MGNDSRHHYLFGLIPTLYLNKKRRDFEVSPLKSRQNNLFTVGINQQIFVEEI